MSSSGNPNGVAETGRQRTLSESSSSSDSSITAVMDAVDLSCGINTRMEVDGEKVPEEPAQSSTEPMDNDRSGGNSGAGDSSVGGGGSGSSSGGAGGTGAAAQPVATASSSHMGLVGLAISGISLNRPPGGTGVYAAIRNSKLANYSAPTLSGPTVGMVFNESFRNNGDQRITVCKEVNNWGTKQNISYSFDPKKFMCTTCPVIHPVGKGTGQKKPVFMLYDQCMPAMAPPTAGGGCLSIIRIEDGTLTELADHFAAVVAGRWLPAGTAVVVAAGGQLAKLGTADYAASVVAAVNKLKRILPGGSFVAHGPLFFSAGIDSPAIIRSVAEIVSWQVAMDREGAIGDFLPMANTLVVRMMERRGIGQQAKYCIRLGLPANMTGLMNKTWESNGSVPLPEATEALTEEDEAEILFLMATELNRKLAIGLDPRFNTARTVATSLATITKTIFVGGDHAAGLARAANRAGLEATLVAVPSRPDVGQVANCARLLREKVEAVAPNLRPAVLVIMSFLDEGVYMVKTGEGGIVPLKEPKRDRVHVNGKLCVATGELLEERIGHYNSLFTSTCGAAATLLTVLPRHLDGPCCEKPAHMPGYEKQAFKSNLMAMIDASRRAIKDLLYKSRIRGIQVANIGRTAANGSWKDPVTPDEANYDAIWATLHQEVVAREEMSRASGEKRPGGQLPRVPGRRPR